MEQQQIARSTTVPVFTQDQKTLIRRIYAPRASEEEFLALISVAERRQLDPFLGQCHFVSRRDQDGGVRWTVQVGIDGLRAIAERTGLYAGQDEPEYEYDRRQQVICCKVRVYRRDISRPFVGIAHWDEYAQYKGDRLTRMWAEKPLLMLAKCAEALGIRKAFPQDCGDLYTTDELPVAEVLEAKPTPAPATKAKPSNAQSPALVHMLEAASSANSLDLLQALRRDLEEADLSQPEKAAARRAIKARYDALRAKAEPATEAAGENAAWGLSDRPGDPPTEQEAGPGAADSDPPAPAEPKPITDEDRAGALQALRDGLVKATKPVDLEELRGAVADALERGLVDEVQHNELQDAIDRDIAKHAEQRASRKGERATKGGAQ